MKFIYLMIQKTVSLFTDVEHCPIAPYLATAVLKKYNMFNSFQLAFEAELTPSSKSTDLNR
jgi:hypothetical protein